MTWPPRLLGAASACAILTLLCVSSCNSSASSAGPFDGERAFETLREIVALGPRVSGSESSVRTRAIIAREVASVGLKVQEYSFKAETPLGEREMVNVVAEIQGTRPGVIILSNHYDTKYFEDFEFVGANDGGSTTAWMIEMARVLGPTREGYSVWLVWFDAEEAFETWSDSDSLYGSRAMVSRLKAEGGLEQVRAMINVDMIGDCDLSVWKDREAPAWMVDLVWDTARGLGYTAQFSPVIDSTEDDHVPFRRAGIPSMNLIDFRYGGGRVEHTMNWHTSRDRLGLVCSESLQAAGDVLYAALPRIDEALHRVDEQGGDGED